MADRREQYPNLPRGLMGGYDRPPAGVLGPERAPQERRSPNLLDRILGLYGQDPMTHIPEGQRGSALGRGLRRGGMAAASISGRGHDRPSTGQHVANFLGAMGGTGAAMGAENQQMERQQQIQELISSGQMGAEQLQAVMMQLVGQGDYEGARSIGEVLKTMLAGKEDRFKTIPKGAAIFDTNSEKWIYPDGQGGYQEIDSWLDLGDQKVPVIGGVPRHELAEAKGEPLGSQRNRASSQTRWAVTGYNKDVAKVEPSYRLTKAALRDKDGAIGGDGAAQLTLLYGFIRALDPNSVVREGEVRLAQEAASLRDRAIQAYNFLVEDKSKIMSPRMAENIANVMERLAADNETYLGGLKAHWGGTVASGMNIDPSFFRNPVSMFSGGDPMVGAGTGPIAATDPSAYADLANKRFGEEGETVGDAVAAYAAENGEWQND